MSDDSLHSEGANETSGSLASDDESLGEFEDSDDDDWFEPDFKEVEEEGESNLDRLPVVASTIIQCDASGVGESFQMRSLSSAPDDMLSGTNSDSSSSSSRCYACLRVIDPRPTEEVFWWESSYELVLFCCVPFASEPQQVCGDCWKISKICKSQLPTLWSHEVLSRVNYVRGMRGESVIAPVLMPRFFVPFSGLDQEFPMRLELTWTVENLRRFDVGSAFLVLSSIQIKALMSVIAADSTLIQERVDSALLSGNYQSLTSLLKNSIRPRIAESDRGAVFVCQSLLGLCTIRDGHSKEGTAILKEVLLSSVEGKITEVPGYVVRFFRVMIALNGVASPTFAVDVVRFVHDPELVTNPDVNPRDVRIIPYLSFRQFLLACEGKELECPDLIDNFCNWALKQPSPCLKMQALRMMFFQMKSLTVQKRFILLLERLSEFRLAMFAFAQHLSFNATENIEEVLLGYRRFIEGDNFLFCHDFPMESGYGQFCGFVWAELVNSLTHLAMLQSTSVDLGKTLSELCKTWLDEIPVVYYKIIRIPDSPDGLTEAIVRWIILDGRLASCEVISDCLSQLRRDLESLPSYCRASCEQLQRAIGFSLGSLLEVDFRVSDPVSSSPHSNVDLRESQRAMDRLGDVLLCGIDSSYFDGADRILIVANDLLLGVPWLTLPLADGSILIDHWDCVFSGSVLMYNIQAERRKVLRERRRVECGENDCTALLIGNFIYENQPILENAARELNDVDASLLELHNSRHSTDGSRLGFPIVRMEGLNQDFESFKTYLKFRPSIIHIATHFDKADQMLASTQGTTSSLNPFSFHGGARLSGENVLHSRQLIGLDMSFVEVAFLNGCASVSGNIHASEGILGFPRSLYQCGVNYIVGNVFPVQDAIGRFVAKRFYQFLVRTDVSTDPCQALRKALLELIRRIDSALCNSTAVKLAVKSLRSLPMAWAGYIVWG